MTQPDVVLDSPERTVGTAGDYLELMKPRIIMLVVFTFIAGLVAAQSVTGLVINPVLAIVATIAVGLGSGAAGAINMWFDADIDARMARTATRPIPSGAVPREEALSLGIIISAMSVLLMWMASNVLAAVILAISIVYYGVFYTMLLKRRTPQNIVIGGAAGAFPPLIGWVAVTGAMSVDAWILFAIIFFWTPPHFWALSLVAHKEYERVGVPMLPVTHGARATRKQMLAYTLILTPIALAPLLTGLGGIVYAFVSVPVSLGFIYFAVRIYRSRAGDADAGDK